MVLNCAACKGRYKRGISFHRFPLDRPDLLPKWVSFVIQGGLRPESWQPNKFSSICNKHFTSDCYKASTNSNKSVLIEDAVPSIVVPVTLSRKGRPPGAPNASFHKKSQMEESDIVSENRPCEIQKTSTLKTAPAKFSWTKPEIKISLTSTSKESDLKTLCRVCSCHISKENNEAIPLFSEDAQRLGVLELMKQHLPVQLPRRNDRLPHLICHNCVGRLQVCDEVAQMAAVSEDTFRNILGLRASRHLTRTQYVEPIDLSKDATTDNAAATPKKSPPISAPTIDSDADSDKLEEEPCLWSSSPNTKKNAKLPPSAQKSIQCTICSVSSNTPKLMKSHYFKMHRKEMCKYCFQCFDTIDECVKHCHTEHRQACIFCGFYFLDREKLLNHVKNTHPDKLPHFIEVRFNVKENIECSICKVVCTSKLQAKKHYFRDHFQYACDICLELHPTSQQQTEHTNAIHVIPCPVCKGDFYSAKLMTDHLSTVHGSIIPRNYLPTRAPFECRLCGKGLQSKVDKKRHLYWSHKRYMCDFCTIDFESAELENEHFEQLHCRECYICGAELLSCAQLESHISSKHEQSNLFCCESCGKVTDVREELLQHRAHHKSMQKTHVCHICNERFESLPGLKTHVRAQHNIEGLSCPVCKKNFPDQALLNSHMKSHLPASMRKQFKCLDCGASYSRAISLQNHMLQHHTPTVKLFRCKECGQEFFRKSSLVDHIKSLHSEISLFKCMACNRGYATETDVIAHLMSHKPLELVNRVVPYMRINAFKCDFCSDFFVCKDKLESHMQTHLRKKASNKNAKIMCISTKVSPLTSST